MVPTLGYSLLLQQTIHWTTIWSYVLLAIAVVSYYELGYIFNDTYTTKRELRPTIRLSERQSAYVYQHVSSIVATRLVWVLGLLCTYGIFNSWSGNSILTIFGVLLLIPIFSLYNHLRGLPAVLFYPVLVGWRYVVFLLPVWGNDHWLAVATLLLLSYPIEIGIERYSMPQHRYGWMATIIPDEQSKQKFRAYYYLTILCVLLPIWLHHPAWCIPILCIGIYRWMRYAPKYVCWALLLLPNLYVLSVYGDLQLWQSKQLIDKQNKQLSTFCFGLESRHDSIPEHYILVLGESARADHMQLNGYKRSTNPYLSHVENIFSFDHVYSEANLTTYSIPLMLTRANAFHYSSAFQEKSISEAFAEAGFQTAWISNNCKISYIKRIMQMADYTDKHFSLLSSEYTEPDTIFSLTGSEKMHFTTR